MVNFIKNFLLTIWQLPQILIGWLILCFVNMNEVELINGRLIVYSKFMRGGISLGRVIIMGLRYHNDGVETDEKHEYGHIIQSQYLGWFYLLIIGIPSFLWATFHKGSMYSYYRDFYTERWADKLGGVVRNEEANVKSVQMKRRGRDSYYKCFACGGELVWEGDFMRSEIDGCDESEDTVVNILHCTNCGATVQVYHPIESENK